MKKSLPLLMLFSLHHGMTHAVGSHCPDEAIFNCRLESGKVASLCAVKSDRVSDEDQYLQYRMGRPGKVEFVFPRADRPQERQFQYWSVHSRISAENSVEFRTPRARYEIVTTWYPEFNDMGEAVVNRPPGGVDTRILVHPIRGDDTTLQCVEATPLETPILRNVQEMMKERR